MKLSTFKQYSLLSGHLDFIWEYEIIDSNCDFSLLVERFDLDFHADLETLDTFGVLLDSLENDKDWKAYTSMIFGNKLDHKDASFCTLCLSLMQLDLEEVINDSPWWHFAIDCCIEITNILNGEDEPKIYSQRREKFFGFISAFKQCLIDQETNLIDLIEKGKTNAAD